jgi:hypothetical protein
MWLGHSAFFMDSPWTMGTMRIAFLGIRAAELGQ